MTLIQLWIWGKSKPWITESKTDTQWKWRKKEDTLYIAFQGTVSFLDWLFNLKFWKKPYKEMEQTWYAHSGFLKKWKDCRTNIKLTIDYQKPKKIIIYGFSQGAGIATLAHEWVWFNYKDINLETIIVGAPRCISIFNDIENRFENLKRYELKKDLVTSLPPKFFLYKHVGKLIWRKKTNLPFWKLKKIHLSYGSFFV